MTQARAGGWGAGAAIVCDNLVRIYTVPATRGEQRVEVVALQGLDLVVETGEVVALVGASGSGKSTLLGILSGLDEPTAGTARVGGHDLLGMGRRERVRYQRHTVGFVWQQTARNLLPHLTAVENVAMPMAFARVPARRRQRRALDLLDLLGVGAQGDRRPGQMSGGQQQRVAIAVALANSPEVLLADEPTGELDSVTSAEVLEAFRDANRELGVTVLLVTHDPLVSEHVGRTVAIRDGRTSSEVLRRVEVDEHGRERHVAEEFAVLDRAGRLQLPRDFIGALDLRDRVRLALEPDHVQVRPDTSGAAVDPDGPAVDPDGPRAGQQDDGPAGGADR
ncbi:ABC transporter ATP-binding protein [Kineosporiaceae bacterium SCSIO 59966]|jgi:ABC-type lipoprotein export system ATPase subunit|nr:ABC transporter ATP-binding protein [Kineosporiaceae bacterium SCSIO 59966]